MESVVGSRVPDGIYPRVASAGCFASDNWELLLINSEYRVASDAVNEQIDELNAIVKQLRSHRACSSAKRPV